MSNAAPANDPSMDEILSSIRQIISEEDVPAADAPAPEPVVAAAPVAEPAPVVAEFPEAVVPEAVVVPEMVAPVEPPVAEISLPEVAVELPPEVEPAMELEAMQIVEDPLELQMSEVTEPEILPEPVAIDAAVEEEVVADIAELTADEDLMDVMATQPAQEPLAPASLAPASDGALDALPVDIDSEMADFEADLAGMDAEIDVDLIEGEDIVFDDTEEVADVTELATTDEPCGDIDLIEDDVAFDTEEPDVSATMPETGVRDELADALLSPATEAVASAAFANLSSLAINSSPSTVEDLIRGMLRPLLKEWLDDNLPTMVERLVQEEIERVSRG